MCQCCSVLSRRLLPGKAAGACPFYYTAGFCGASVSSCPWEGWVALDIDFLFSGLLQVQRRDIANGE